MTPSLVNVGRHRNAMADAEALARRGRNSVYCSGKRTRRALRQRHRAGASPPPTSLSGRGPFENGRVVVVGDSLRTVWMHNISATILRWTDIYTPGVLSPSEDHWLIVPLGRDWRLATAGTSSSGSCPISNDSSSSNHLSHIAPQQPSRLSIEKRLVPNISSRTTIRYGFHSGTCSTIYHSSPPQGSPLQCHANHPPP